jgi:hypothetical protein
LYTSIYGWTRLLKQIMNCVILFSNYS